MVFTVSHRLTGTFVGRFAAVGESLRWFSKTRFAWVALLLCGFTWGAPPAPSTQVKIGNGINTVDLLGDGTPGMIVSGHRENFNAHSFDVFSFYLQINSVAGVKEWNIVPIMEKTKERMEITVSGGADCRLHDFRLIPMQGNNPATLILADRALGDSFSSTEAVTFTFFSLTYHAGQVPGFPPFSFDFAHASKTKTDYCDVGDAFQKELGLGNR